MIMNTVNTSNVKLYKGRVDSEATCPKPCKYFINCNNHIKIINELNLIFKCISYDRGCRCTIIVDCLYPILNIGTKV